MKTLRKAAVLALASLSLAPHADAREDNTEWWNVDFESPTPVVHAPERDYGGNSFTIGELGALTNNYLDGITQPYASGLWTALDGDESYITNGIVTNALGGTSGTSDYLKLDTQGNDLTWAPSNTVADAISVVDADLLLVGSDSAPDASDFDASGDVQTAVYLRNYQDEDTGVITNSLFCVYVRDGNTGKPYWQELDGVPLADNSWHHVQVIVDYTADQPQVKVYVDGTQMHALGNAATLQWTAANMTVAQTAGKVQSVSFRGTGAVDNFAGVCRKETFDSLTFAAEVYLNGVKQATGLTGNATRYKDAEAGDAGSGKTVTFENFLYHDFDLELQEPPTYSLRKIELFDFVGGTTTTLNYGYDAESKQVLPETTTNAVRFIPMELEDEETGESYELFYGPFNVTAITDGASDPTNLIAKIYLKSIGSFDVYAEKYDDGSLVDTEAYTFATNDIVEGATQVFSFPYAKTVNGSNYVLSALEPAAGLVPAPGASAATVTVQLYGRSSDLRAAKAYYVPGDYTGKAVVMNDPAEGSSTYTFFGALAQNAGTGEYYDSLREAIEDADAGDTVVLLGDDRVSFSATATEIGITKALTIDGGSNTLYGVSAYAYDGHNDHDIYIGGSGNVTIKNLTLSEFSDTAPTVQYRTYPIWTGQKYAGTLVLDGVTVTNYARTAVNLSGGSFLITNCVFAGYADAASPTRYYQDAVVVFNATGTVANTTVTGVGDANTGYGASVFTVNSSGAGEITVKSGSYTGAYIAAVNSNATGRITIEGGTFVATNTNGEDEKPDTAFEPANTVGKIVITGGWFNLEPEAEFLAAGLQARKLKADSDPAPWTVGQVFTVNFWTGDELDGAPAYWTTNAFTGETGYGPAADPTKDATAGATYAFAGWTNEVAGGAAVATADLPAVDGAASWLAVWTETANTFDVVFMNGEAQFATTNVAYGTTEYAPTGTPTKAATAQFTYAFAGWSDTADGEALASLPAVTNDATFYAAFTATTNEYTITWTMDDDSVIDTTTVAYGTVPTHADASKTPDAQYAYTFNGWDPDPVAVTGEATYKATFTQALRSYDVTFWTGDEPIGGQAFWATNVLFGATGYGPTNDPVKAATTVTNFTFAGWTNEVAGGAAVATADLPAVGGDATWTAVWTETPIWRVDFYAGEDGGTVCYTTNVLDGTELDKPADADLDPVPSKAATASHTFTFVGWTDEIGGEQLRWVYEIKKDTAFYPVFSSNAVEYAITFWTNGVDVGTAYFETNAPYGSTGYGPADPAKAGFAFGGWTNTVAGGAAVATADLPPVAGAAKWLAVWTASEIHVNPGDGLEKYKEDNPAADVPEPIEFVEPATPQEEPKAKIAFVAPSKAKYVLLSSTTLETSTDTWSQDANSVPVQASEGDLVELVEGDHPGTVKFFAIGILEE